MNEISTQTVQLPDSLPDLSKFALIGREKLNAVRAEIRAIEKVGLAKEVHEQKLLEAQEIAEAVLDAEAKIGELTAKIPKAQGFASSISDSGVANTKQSKLSEIGIQPRTAERFERLAKHPQEVQEAKETARQEGRIVTRQDVFKTIQEVKKPHVANNSTDNEWYTPSKYIESARKAMGSIDLDPASNDFANETVNAETYYTEEINGLNQEWFGNIWMNPPYSTALLSQFADKLVASDFTQAIVLVNNATETAWFEKMISRASAIVFHKGRIKFVKRDGEHGTPLQGQAFIYYGDNAERFLEVFEEYGWGAKL